MDVIEARHISVPIFRSLPGAEKEYVVAACCDLSFSCFLPSLDLVWHVRHAL